jgi:hypothetical protein
MFEDLTPYELAVAIDRSGCGIGILLVRNQDKKRFVGEVWNNAIGPFASQETLVDRFKTAVDRGKAHVVDPSYFDDDRKDPIKAVQCYIDKYSISIDQQREWLWKNAEVVVPDEDLVKQIAEYLRNTPEKVLGLKFVELRTEVPTKGANALVLDFSKIMQKYLGVTCIDNESILSQIFTYLIDGKSSYNTWKNYLENYVFPFCHTMEDSSVVGFAISGKTILCSLVHYYSLPMCNDRDRKQIPDGNYTYILSTFENQLFLDVAEMNPEELGTRHSCILNAVFHRAQGSIVIAAGEMMSQAGNIWFNFSSGTVMIETFDFSVSLVSGLALPHFIGEMSDDPAYNLFWIPAVTFILQQIFGEQVSYIEDTFAAPVFSDDYVRELCQDPVIKDNMYVYSDVKVCQRDKARKNYDRKFC